MAEIARRDILTVAASLAAPAWASAQATATTSTAAFRRSAEKSSPKSRASRSRRPMTAAEESRAAIAVGESIADETGEPMHPAVGRSLRLRNPVKLFDGSDYGEKQAEGKLLLVFFWASWCPICKIVAPKLDALWQNNHARGLEVLALSTDTTLQPAWDYIQRTRYRYPVGMAASASLDAFATARSLPTLMVRSKLGVLVSIDEGEVDEEDFAGYLAHL